MKPVRVGIIGCGVIGKHHAASAASSELIEIAALADLREEAVRPLAEQYNVPKAYSEADELIRDESIEAVVIAMPAHLRTELALKAFGTGKHVLTEKPVALNAGEVQQMIDAQGDLVAACCSCRYRFLPSAQAASEFIGRGELGAIRSVHCRNFSPARGRPESMPPEWRLKKSLNGGGILMNWGCYEIDYLLGITNWTLKPRTVFAQTWQISETFRPHIPDGSDAETHYTALIRCEGGAMLSMERGEYMPAHARGAWQIIGENGSLELYMTSSDASLIFCRADDANGIVEELVWEGTADNSVVHNGPLHDLAAAIRSNREPKTSLKNALVVQKISDAIYASGESGTAAEISG
jgi:UDP-N-acetyl-2-amino-2-deoxyglucuronate dehydrogenase